jgi:hypothetical protein
VAVPLPGCSALGEDAASALSNIARWRCDVVDQLPEGRGSVVIVGTQAAGYRATVTLTWTDDVGKANNVDDNAAGIGNRTTFRVETLL